MSKKQNGPKILILDIETSPILASVWGLFDQNIPLNMIERDWAILSYAAKWKGESKVFYEDNRKSKDIEDDSSILHGIWKLLDEADIVIGQNSQAFDVKKLNARFIKNGMGPPSPFRQIDTLKVAKKHFLFTSNKLEYTSNLLCPEEKKSQHKAFPGFELWKECIKGNKKAWEELKQYNIQDVIATEKYYEKLQPWDQTVKFSVYNNSTSAQCNCGSYSLVKNGYNTSSTGRFQRYKCSDCGANHMSKKNLLTKEKKASLLK